MIGRALRTIRIAMLASEHFALIEYGSAAGGRADTFFGFPVHRSGVVFVAALEHQTLVI